MLDKRLLVDLLDIADPDGIPTPARPGEYGVGPRSSFPFVSVESVEVLGGDRLLVANDDNFPFDGGRFPDRTRPDDTEMAVLRVPGLRGPVQPRGAGAARVRTGTPAFRRCSPGPGSIATQPP